MTEPEPPEPLESPPHTAWHPMLVALLSRFLPSGYRLVPEFLLSRLSQRADILVIRLEDATTGPVERLHSILDYLAAHTLIEYKGPTDDLAGEDVLTLLGYGYQYMRLAKLKEPRDVCLMVIADRMTQSFLDQAKRSGVTIVEVGEGIWRGSFAGFTVHGVETGKASGRGPTEHLLYPFSRAFLERPEGAGTLDPDEVVVYHWLYQQVEQFKRERGTMAVKDVETLKQLMEVAFDRMAIDHPELFERILANIPPERRLQGLRPEERVQGLRPEERVQGLRPEERVQGLRPEERLQGLRPEERLQGLSPEEIEQLRRLLH